MTVWESTGNRIGASNHGCSEKLTVLLFEKQHGCCAVCGELLSDHGLNGMQRDHCHGSGETRGLLCKQCNLQLGKYERTITTLSKKWIALYKESADKYLSEYRKNSLWWKRYDRMMATPLPDIQEWI